MAERKRLTEEEIGALAQAEIAAAVTYDGTDFQKNRVRAIEYYRGEMKDLENEEGLSEAVTHDVQDVIGWILPGLMRVFFSADELGQYSPEDENDEQSAKQATDYANHVIMKECNGYEVFWDVFHDGLLHANGLVKHWWEESEKTTVHFVTGLDDEQWAELVNNKEIEVISHREDEVPVDYGGDESDEAAAPIELPGPPMPEAGPHQSPGMPPPGPMPPGAPAQPQGAAPGGPPLMNGGPQPPVEGGGASPLPEGLMALLNGSGGPPAALGGPPPPMLPGMEPPPQTQLMHSAKLKRTKKYGCLKIAAMPPEEFLINVQAKSIATARVTGHRMLKLRSDLIEEGYDADKVNDLPATSFLAGFGNLPQVRRDHAVNMPPPPGLDKSMDEVEVVELYMKMDVDGDGVAEMMKIVMGEPNSNVVLDSELWEDETPFTDFVAERVPHRWQGRSTFDDTEDIQRIKSTLLRQFLDNLYHSNIPDRAVEIDRVSNPDSLVDRKIGNVIHTDGPPNGVVMDLQVPFVAKEALTGLEYMDQIIERRTGVSRATMALDLEALQNQSATAVNAAQSAAYSKIELIARNFAEMGFKRFFQCILKLIVAHQDGPRRIKIRKDWVTMDPSSWNANMKFDVNVGLGSGSRDRDAAILMQIATKQEQINLQMGPDNPVCGIDKYANTLRSLVTMALPSAEPDKFFNEVEPEAIAAWMAKKQASQPQDPKVQAEMQKAQAAQQKAQADIQIKGQKAQADAALAQQKAAAELQAGQQKTTADMQAAQEKNAMNLQATREKNAMQLQTDREKAAQEAQQRQDEALLDAQLKQDEMYMEAQLTREANQMNAANQRHKVDTNVNKQKTTNK